MVVISPEIIKFTTIRTHSSLARKETGPVRRADRRPASSSGHPGRPLKCLPVGAVIAPDPLMLQESHKVDRGETAPLQQSP